MHSEESCIRLSRACGRFFIFLALPSAIPSCYRFHSSDWLDAAVLMVGVPFFGFIGWVAVTSAIFFSKGGDHGGTTEAGKTAPLRPTPTHHLAAAKELPPSDKTHELPKD
jgi:hypothetical protein